MKFWLHDLVSTFFTSEVQKMARIIGVAPPPTVSLKAVQEKYGTQVDFEKFSSILSEICTICCVGFGFAVYDRDKLLPQPGGRDGGGSAVLEDGSEGARHFTADTRLNVHSMSKTITAAVMVRALHLNPEVTLDSAIGPFLPDWSRFLPNIWRIDPAVRRITFQQLLVHNSGLEDVSSSISEKESLGGVIGALLAGIKQPLGKRRYVNANFSLCRMLLPFIDRDVTPENRKRLRDADLDTFDEETTQGFINYVHRHFFDVIDPSHVVLKHEILPMPNGPPPYTRYYDFPADPTKYKTDDTDGSTEKYVGASSWFMSAREYARLIVGLRYQRDFGRPDEAWSPWETMCDFDRRKQPGSKLHPPKEIYFRPGMQEVKIGRLPTPLVGLGKAGGGDDRSPANFWMTFGDLTAVVVTNSSGSMTGQLALTLAAEAAVDQL
jgi:Beta-lactamase